MVASRMEQNARKPSRGMTLTELLAVLAIIGLLSALAVPTFWRMGFFSNDRVTGSARELYALLRAARVYAATNRIETALAYNYKAVPVIADEVAAPEVWDEEFGVTRRYFDEVFMVRRMKRDELERVGLPPDTRRYVPLQSENGNFRPMLGGTCVLLDVGPQVDPAARFPTGEFGLMSDVYVCDPAGIPLYTDQSDAIVPFYGHVFKPSGELKTTSPKQRFELNVGLAPENNRSERFIIDDDPDTTRVEEIEHLATIVLYAATGRVKVAG